MTSYRMLGLAAALAAGIGTAPARAQEINDVRCLLASNAATKVAKDASERRVTEATLHFYLGRLDGKFNSAQLAIAFANQLKTLNGLNIGPTMQACYRHAQQRMMFVQSVGNQLSRPIN